MANHATRTILDHVCRTIGVAQFGHLADDELLRHALAGRDHEGEAAFSVLVQRHGPLVYRTCFGMLRQAQDAEDAFQATFLVLARKAKSLRARRCLGPWLYEVARRVAAHARAAAQRRSQHERAAATPELRIDSPDQHEPVRLLHEALDRLPSRFRLPIVLCDLEELSYQDAATRLGWTLPTVRNRLARGRRRLQTALRRLGLDSTSTLAAYGTIPAVPRLLITSTARTATQVAIGAAATIPVSILALTNQGLQTMLLIKLKTAGLAVLSTAVLIAGAYGLSGQSDKPGGKPADAAPAKPPIADAAKPAADAPATGPAALVAKLTGPASIDKPIDNLPLRDVLDSLSEQYHVTFVVNLQAFDLIGKKTVQDEQVRLQRMPNVTLDAILSQVLPQVSGAVMVRQNYLEVTSYDRAIMEARNGVLITFPEDQQPLVNVACVQRPVESVLTDLARQSGRNVILDSRVKDRDQLAVSLTLLNTPLDTAVRMIAEMVNLKTFSIDNVLFVTTREHASELVAEEQAILERRKSTFAERASPLPTPGKPKP